MKTLKTLFAALAVLVLCTGSAMAGSEYTVKKGDNLTRIARKFNSSVNEIAVSNPIIKNVNKIYPGQVFCIPDQGEVPWNWNRLMGNPFQGTIEEGLARINVLEPAMEAAIIEKVRAGNFEKVYIEKGTMALATVFGRGIVKKNVKINWEGWAKKYTAQVETDSFIRTCSMLYPDCGNPTPWFCEEQLKSPPSVPAPPETEEIPPVTEEKVPGKPKIKLTTPRFSIAPKYSIAMHKPIACRDYELNARQGFWMGENAHGEFSYSEGGIWKTCWGWGEMIGFYGNRDSSDADDTAFDRNSWGVGPQVGLRYLDFYTRKDGTIGFHGFTSKLRLIYAKTSGKNMEEAYRMTQEEIMLGLYAEYVRQLSQKTTVAATFEIWISLHRHMETTFRGDTPSNRGQAQIGGYVQNKLNEDWAIRNGANLFHHMWDREQGVGVFSEIRYQNFLLAGFAANFSFAGGANYGPYVGIEAGNKWRERADRKIEEGIWSVDADGNRLNKNDEDRIWDTNGSDTACKECTPAISEQSTPAQAEVEEITTIEVVAVMVTDGSPRIQFDKNGEPATLIDQANFDREVRNISWPNTQ